MAAGLGFKDFTTGEVLTAADVDGYLMQGIWVFASAAARDAAVTSPQEGNFAFLKDTNTTTYYTGSAWTNLDTTGMVNPMTTTGDTIYSSSGSTPARLGIGSTGQVLTVAGGVPTWATPGGAFVGCFLYNSASQSVATGVQTVLNFDSESYDTDGFHSTTSNTGRITIPSGKGGKYIIGGQASIQDSNNAKFILTQKNGASTFVVAQEPLNTPSNTWYATWSSLYNLSAGDYVEQLVEQNSGSWRQVYGGSPQDYNFYCIYLGA